MLITSFPLGGNRFVPHFFEYFSDFENLPWADRRVIMMDKQNFQEWIEREKLLGIEEASGVSKFSIFQGMLMRKTYTPYKPERSRSVRKKHKISWDYSRLRFLFYIADCIECYAILILLRKYFLIKQLNWAEIFKLHSNSVMEILFKFKTKWKIGGKAINKI